MKTIGIIGIGLIGGSLGIALKENSYASQVLGADKNPDNLDKALRRRLIDAAASLEELVAQADVLVLATPVDAMRQLLPHLLDQLRPDQVLLDVGSTKQLLLEGCKDHPRRGRYVATHPMAGTEYSGPEAAQPGLFKNKVCVLVDTADSEADALATVRELYGSIPMQLTELDRVSHDLHCAYVSHISHIASFALALTVLEKEKDEQRIFDLAGSGFSSTVRLAKSSAAMWTPIFRQNRDNILDVLDEHIEQLSRFRTLLIKNNFEEFSERIKRANQIAKILK
ncbi:MAG: prephenate dehydrogenase [Lewinella sp.]|nr:prephenate dehydrogenase [Lewinella sp.]